MKAKMKYNRKERKDEKKIKGKLRASETIIKKIQENNV